MQKRVSAPARRALRVAGSGQERLEAVVARARLAHLRRGEDTVWRSSDEPEPLVTVRVATLGQREELVDRCLPSILEQTYERLEILVVAEREGPVLDDVRRLGDPRVRVHVLSRPGRYPSRPRARWMVAGCAPMNWALAHHRGKWLAPCDDDDELTRDHVAVLLDRVRAEGAELVYSQTLVQFSDGASRVIGNGEFPATKTGQVSHGCVLYASPLRFIRHNVRSWWLDEAADGNMWRRMSRFGVRVCYQPSITYVYHRPSNYIPGTTQTIF